MINAQGLYTLTFKTSTASYEIYQGASLRAAKSRNDSPTFYVDISPRMTSMVVYKSYSMKQLAFARYRASFEITIHGKTSNLSSYNHWSKDRLFILSDGTCCETRWIDNVLTISDIESGDALATFEKSHSGIRKQGVLRMSAPGYTDDDLP